MRELLPIVLLAAAGFLFGGAYTLYRTARVFAVLLGLAGSVALAGGIAWLF